MARTLNGKLTGKAAHGIDEIMVDEPSTLTAEDRARIKDDVSVGYHKYQAHLWAKEVQPVDVDKFLLAMQFIRLQEKPTSKTINLNGYKATATASWRERHLNEGK